MTAILLAAILVTPLAAQQLVLKTYSAADGLPYVRIERIVPDSHGFLWFCTADGLGRFDGTRFVNFGSDQAPQERAINDILENPGGSYWIATNGAGLARFNTIAAPSQFITVAVGKEPAVNRVNVLYRSRSGLIWVGTDGGLFTLRETGGRVSVTRFDLSLPEHPDLLIQVWAILEDAEGSLWIGTKFGLVRVLPDGRKIHYPVRPDTAADHVFSLSIDKTSTLWAGHSSGVALLRPAPFNRLQSGGPRVLKDDILIRAARSADVSFTRPGHSGEARFYNLGNTAVDAIHEFPDGRVWILVRLNGLYEIKDGNVHLLNTAPRLNADLFRTMAEDRDGNMWLGTISSGGVKVLTNGFVSFNASDGLPYSPVRGISEDLAGKVVVTGGLWGIGWFDGLSFHGADLNIPPGHRVGGWSSQQSLIQDHLGEWWAATKSGLYRFPKIDHPGQLATARPKALYTEADGLAETEVTRLFEDSRGDIWISTFAPGKSAVTRWDRTTSRFVQYAEEDGLPGFNSPSVYAEDRSRNVWIGFREGGLVRYRAGRFQRFGPADGVPDGEIRTCYCDHADHLWCGHIRAGLIRLDHLDEPHPQVEIYPARRGFARKAISAIGEDAEGRLYLGTARGVDRIDPVTNELNHFGSSEGLPSGEMRRIFRDHGGAMWFSSAGGLSRLVPGGVRSTAPSPVMIAGVRIGGVDQPVSVAGVRELSVGNLPPGKNSLQIDYLRVGFTVGDAQLFQYRLGEGEWGESTQLQVVNYASLAPGSYRFQVRAADVKGAERPAQVSFRVLPPFWRQWWFITLSWAVGGSLITAIWLYREDRRRVRQSAEKALQRSREERLEELERVRRRIATDLHDDIGSSLTQVSILSELLQRQVADPDSPMVATLDTIARCSRELVDDMSDIVWAITPQRDRLSDLVYRMRRFAGETFRARDIELQLTLPSPDENVRLDGNFRREVYLIFKESVSNVVRHSRCTAAEIELRIASSILRLSVRDNGRGFDAAAATQGHGLASMRSRAAGIGAGIELASAPGNGTSLILEVPLPDRVALPRSYPNE